MKNKKNDNNFRRVDDFGRIVIPKELRKFLNFNEGALLEFFVNDDETSLVIRRPKTHKERVNTWIEDVFDHLENEDRDVTFCHHGSAIACVIYDYCYGENYTGLSVCAPGDKYNVKLGEAIAYCRAADFEIPDFVLKGV